jgi:hypothetical protein
VALDINDETIGIEPVVESLNRDNDLCSNFINKPIDKNEEGTTDDIETVAAVLLSLQKSNDEVVEIQNEIIIHNQNSAKKPDTNSSDDSVETKIDKSDSSNSASEEEFNEWITTNTDN